MCNAYGEYEKRAGHKERQIKLKGKVNNIYSWKVGVGEFLLYSRTRRLRGEIKRYINISVKFRTAAQVQFYVSIFSFSSNLILIIRAAKATIVPLENKTHPFHERRV